MSKSRLFRSALLSLLIANILILIGKDDWLARYLMPLHYFDMLITFISVFIVFVYVDSVNQYLDKKVPFQTAMIKRLGFQLVLGVMVPALLAIFFTWIMWEFIWEKGLVEGNYFKYEFFPQLLLIVVVNLIFIVLELFESKSGDPPETILVRKGREGKPLLLQQVSFVQLKSGVVFVVTEQGDKYTTNKNVDAMGELLPPDQFFRVNRQVIIKRSSCKSYKSIEYGKIAIQLNHMESSVIVSQRRAAAFRAWIASNS